MGANIIASLKVDGAFSSQFEKYVVDTIAKKIRKRSIALQALLTDQIQELVRARLSAADEYHSIVGGKLRAQLGIPDAATSVADIVEAWINGIAVIIKTGRHPFLTIHIGMIRDDYEDVLSLSSAEYTFIRSYASFPPERRGQEDTIPWLQWLLLEGDRRIITDYEFIPKGAGRTGMGVMKRNVKKAWQVPPEFSGTSVDNFATRALSNIYITIDKIVEEAIRGLMK